MKRTIVGGRPPADAGGAKGVPRGIEVLLRKAHVDPEFREALLRDPGAAAASIALALTESERRILESVPRAQLAGMIDHVEVPEEHRKVFRGRAAAAMLAVLAGTFVACIPEPAPTGSRPDEPRPTSEQAAPAGEEPAATESPPAGENPNPYEEPGPTRGIRPDDPEAPR